MALPRTLRAGDARLLLAGQARTVFVDSAWWHGHRSRWTPGRHPAKSDEKIRANRARDELVNRQLADQGWAVVRIWDFELASLDASVRHALDQA
jgi:DNA mismatch endonuclease (patch repair protein)